MKGEFHRALLEREMTRKEFLQLVGASLVMLLGVPNLLKLLQRPTATSQAQHSDANHGFGSRKFGA